ncbi:MAG: CDP-alcohol phosphatidyltransferase family protein, partial [Terriglobia bacterium]
IVGREVAVLGMRLVARGEGFAVPVSELGKAKMVLQVCAAALLILASRYPALLLPGTVALWLVLLFALISAARYLVQFWRGLEAASRQSAPLVIVRPNDEEREERDVAAQQR